MSSTQNQNVNKDDLTRTNTQETDLTSVISTPRTYHSLVTSQFTSTPATSIYGDSDKDDKVTSSPRTSETSDDGALELKKVDEALEATLGKEASINDLIEAPVVSSQPNPYALWECGFGFTAEADEFAAIASTKAEFLQAVQAELNLVTFMTKGLVNYNQAIHSGEHHAFSEEFLSKQTLATTITIGQLYQISEHLKEITKEVENTDATTNEVKTELLEAVAHARPWIHRTRAIIVSGHVFYKINYVLDSKNKKKTTG